MHSIGSTKLNLKNTGQQNVQVEAVTINQQSRVGPYTRLCVWASVVFTWIQVLPLVVLTYADGAELDPVMWAELYCRFILFWGDEFPLFRMFEVGLRDMFLGVGFATGNRIILTVTDLRQDGLDRLFAWIKKCRNDRDSGPLWAAEVCRNRIRRQFWAWQTLLDRHIRLRNSINLWFEPFTINFHNGLEVLCFDRIVAHNLMIVERRRLARARRRRALRSRGLPVPSPASSHSSSSLESLTYQSEGSTEEIIDAYKSDLPSVPVDPSLPGDDHELNDVRSKITPPADGENQAMLVECWSWWHPLCYLRPFFGVAPFITGSPLSAAASFVPPLFWTDRKSPILDHVGGDLVKAIQGFTARFPFLDFPLLMVSLAGMALCPLPFGRWNFEFTLLVFSPLTEEVLKRVSPTWSNVFIAVESLMYGDDWISGMNRCLLHEYWAKLPYSKGVFNHALFNFIGVVLYRTGINGYVLYAVLGGAGWATIVLSWIPVLRSFLSDIAIFSPRLSFALATATRLFDVYVGHDTFMDVLTYLVDKIRGRGSELQLGSSLARNPKARLWQSAILRVINDLAERVVSSPTYRPEGFSEMKDTFVSTVKGPIKSGLETLESAAGYLGSIKESGIYGAIMTLFATICAIPVIFETEKDPEGAVSEFRRKFEECLPLSRGNVAINFLTSFKTALTFLARLSIGEDAVPLDETTSFLTEVSWLRVHLVKVSNHKVDGLVPTQEFSARLTGALKKSGALMKKKGSPGVQSMIVRAIGELSSIQADFEAQFGGLTKRERAIAVVICGRSGTGKSQLVDAFTFRYLRFKGLIPNDYVVPPESDPLDEFRGQYVAKRTPGDKFDSTISNSTAVYIEEECNRYNTSMYQTTPQEHYIPRLLSLVDEQPTPVLKADLSEKGRVVNRAGLNLFVSNSPFEGMSKACNAASIYPALTRPIFVHMEVVADFQKGNMQIDPSKVKNHVENEGGRYTDPVRYSIGRAAFRGDPISAAVLKPLSQGAKYPEEPVCIHWEDGLCFSDLMSRFDQMLEEQKSSTGVSKAAVLDYLGVCRVCRGVVCSCEMTQEGAGSWFNPPMLYVRWFVMWKLYIIYCLDAFMYASRSMLKAKVMEGSIAARVFLWLRPEIPHWSSTWSAYTEAEFQYDLASLLRRHSRAPMTKERFENETLRIRVKYLERELSNNPKSWRYNMAIGFIGGLITALATCKLISFICSQTFNSEGTGISMPAKRSTTDTIEELEKRVDAGSPVFPPPRQKPAFPLPTFEKFELDGKADQYQPLEVTHKRVLQSTYCLRTFTLTSEGTRGPPIEKAFALQLVPGVFVTTTHLFGGKREAVVQLTPLNASVLNAICETVVVIDDCLVDGDAVYFAAQCLLKKQDLSGLLREEKLTMSPGSMTRHGYHAYETVTPVTIVSTFGQLPTLQDGPPPGAILYTGRKSMKGDCGQVILMELEKDGRKLYQIVGLHCGSLSPSDYCCAAPVSRTRLDMFVSRCVQRLHYRPQGLCGPIPIDNPLIPLSHKNELVMHIGKHGLYCGSYDVPISRIPMSARPSVMAPYVEKLFPGVSPREFTPPISKRGNYIFPDREGNPRKGYFDPFGTYCNGALVNPGVVAQVKVDPRVARKAIDNFLERLELMVDFTKYKIRPLTHKEAIAGVRDFVRAMNLKTSAGPGFDGIKSKYIKKGTDILVDGTVVESVLAFADAAAQGYFIPLVAKACPKDEVREFKWQKPLDSDEELYAPKPARMFFVSPLPDLIHAKMFVGPLMALAEAESEAFEHIIGINTHSSEWEELHNFFKWAERMFDSDVSGWDKAILFWLLTGLREVVMYLAVRVGYNSYAQAQLWARLCAESNPFVLLQESLVMLENITPSGRVDTTMINSIMMSLFYRIIYYTVFCRSSGLPVEKALEKAPDFNDNVQLKSNGDDAICSVSDQCTFFNQRTMVETGNLMGVACTNGAKTSETTDFRSISEITMLKRHFRFDEEIGRILAPLPYKSLAKSLSMFTETSIPDKDRDVAAISSVILEMFHHGRGEFNRVCGQLKAMMVELGWEDEIGKAQFKTFDQLRVDRFGPQ